LIFVNELRVSNLKSTHKKREKIKKTIISIQNSQKGRFWRFINRKAIEMAFLSVVGEDADHGQEMPFSNPPSPDFSYRRNDTSPDLYSPALGQQAGTFNVIYFWSSTSSQSLPSYHVSKPQIGGDPEVYAD
jgi:hypothetical protein